ncbi:MAG: ATP-binding protein, partial [Gammaproteobacteria bacterium]|nr:ATP-binding protein [Gammaproteobacteria bacterium]
MRIIDEFRRGTLFAKTALTTTLVSSLFLIFTLTLLAIFIIVPTSQRSAASLASLISLSADVWQNLSEQQRSAFTDQLNQRYQIELTTIRPDLVARTRHPPFFALLEDKMEQLMGEKVTILQSNKPAERSRYWVPIRQADGTILVGFEYSHMGLDPPITILILIVVGVIASFIAAVILAHRLTKPLASLARASQQIGCGAAIKPLPEQGPLELAELVQSFNIMALQIQDLLANRTTLLAGISHDLRTPLTRLKLVLEMLEKDCNPALLKQAKNDIGQMDRLIGLFLEVSRGLQEEKRQRINIKPLLDKVVEEFIQGGAKITWQPGPDCFKLIHPLALRRIIGNLLENAVRYGEGKAIILNYRVEGKTDSEVVIIEVLDQGPGIPDDQLDAVFQPFHRLEQSRSTHTGGSGLGLSIAQQLASANGCKVELIPRDSGGICARITIGQK